MNKIAIVTGANRNIGLEVCRQLSSKGIKVILTARTKIKAETAAKNIENLVIPKQLDVTDKLSINNLFEEIKTDFGKLDILINNAGINYDMDNRATTVSLDYVRNTLETNFFGAWAMIQKFLPLLRKSTDGRIINVTSQASTFNPPKDNPFGLTQLGGSVPAYSISKVALNALTVKLAAELQNEKIIVNGVCPGFVATYPGMAEMGARPVYEGAASIVRSAMLTNDRSTGKLFGDGKPLAW